MTAPANREEWTGQLEGGPDEGNLVSATVRRFRHEVTYRYWPDGQGGEVAELTVRGHYVWNEPTGTFRWERSL